MSKSRFQAALEHHQAGRFAEAEPLYRKVLTYEPNHADALHLLGVLAAQTGRLDDAVDLIRRACAVSPNAAEYRTHLGNVLNGKRDFEASADAYRQALRLNPACYISHDGLGAALREVGQLDEAIASHRQSLAISPGNLVGHLNLGLSLGKKGLLDEAMASYRRAIAINPHVCDGHWNLSQLLLLRGEYEEGWRQYEWRWQRQNFPILWPAFSRPRWSGEDLHGKTLLVHTEQGYGDAFQFVRYVPMLAARGARVLLLCQEPLARLFENVDGVDQIVPPIKLAGDLPAFDMHCPMMSLPFLMGTRLGTVPADVPYLRPDPTLLQCWREKVGTAAGRLTVRPRNPNAPRVGLVWAGNPEHINDRNRSITLEQLAPLAGIDATVFSLQKGPASAQACRPPSGMRLIDLTEDLRDFADTAAFVSNLDLVITVDTAVAHVAGAMGVPTWVLIAGEQDWRWMQDRADSPWYPSMRLFRQRISGEWSEAIQRVARTLANDDQALRPAA